MQSILLGPKRLEHMANPTKCLQLMLVPLSQMFVSPGVTRTMTGNFSHESRLYNYFIIYIYVYIHTISIYTHIRLYNVCIYIHIFNICDLIEEANMPRCPARFLRPASEVAVSASASGTSNWTCRKRWNMSPEKTQGEWIEFDRHYVYIYICIYIYMYIYIYEFQSISMKFLMDIHFPISWTRWLVSSLLLVEIDRKYKWTI